jgi:anti-anti-sigma regulatory factor
MFWCEQGVGDEIIVRFAGVLDATSARDVRQFLNVKAADKVILDFSQVADVDYYGLSVLAAQIA